MAIRRFSTSTIVNNLLRYAKFWDQTSTYSAAPTNSYIPIASYTVPSGGVSSITISGIPQTFTHLQIRMTTITNNASYASLMYFNGDTTDANYKNHAIEANGSSVAAYNYTGPYIPWSMGGAATTSPGAAIIDILDYTNTNKYKTSKALSGYDGNGSGYLAFASTLWMNSNAITSINFTRSGVTFSANMNVSIYGVN